MIPEVGRFPGGENGNPLQYSCPENCMDRETWQVTVHNIAESDTCMHMHAKGKINRNITHKLVCCAWPLNHI